MTFDKWFRAYAKRHNLSHGEAMVAQPVAQAAWIACAADARRFIQREEKQGDAFHALLAAQTYLAP